MVNMKDSGIEWVGECPVHWAVMANKNIMRKVKYIKAVYENEDILSLTMKGVIVRNLEAGGKMPSSFNGYQILYPHNLLMCLFDYDVTPRCIGLIKNYGVSSPAYSQFAMINQNYEGYYYYYYLMIDNTKALLHLAKNLRHSFTEEQLGFIHAPVPPKEEQISIAEFLDKKSLEIDVLLMNIQTEINILDEYKRSIITEKVTKGLNPDVEMKDSGIEWVGECPAHWEVMSNKYIMKKVKCIKAVYENEDILSLTMKGVVVRDLEAGGKMPSSFNGYQILYPHNLLMCLFDYDVTPRCIGLIKNYGLSSPAYSQFVMINQNYEGYYYYYYLMIDDTKALLHLAKNLRHSFTEEQLGYIHAPVPPKEEQREIADYLDKKCAEIDSVIETKKEQLKILDEYKKSIIYEYVTGKKEVIIND